MVIFNFRKVLIFIFIFIVFSSIGYANENTNEKQKNLGQIKKKINAIDLEIKKNTSTQKNLSNELKLQERKIKKTKKQISKIKKKEKINKKKLKNLNKRIKKLQKKLARKKKIYSEVLYQSYIKPKPSYLQMFLEGINPNEITKQINYIGYLSRSQNNNIIEINNTYDNISSTKKLTSKTLKNINTLKYKNVKNSKKLQKQKKQKIIVLNKISYKLKSQKEFKSKLLEDEKKLTNIIKMLIDKSNKENKENKVKTAKTKSANGLPNSKFDGINFAKLKKKLKLPVIGKIVKKFGSKRKDTGVTWKGIFIKAKKGTEVFVVAKGKVVFSDSMRGFGNIIIIDHGNNYMSIYANNEKLLKQKNQIVKGGEIIALVGNTGGNEMNGLYYELRRKSKPFDPLKWTKLK